MPRYLEPMKATLATKAFRDEDWLYEVKWDGYRVEAVVRDGKVSLFTRNGNDAETYFPRLLTPPSWIDAREAIVDGEVVALDERGRPDFSLLQERISAGRDGHARCRSCTRRSTCCTSTAARCVDVPLEQRKKLLELVLRPNVAGPATASHIDTEGVAFFEAVKAQGLEGIVAKHRRSRYEPGRRASSWLKIKARPEQELVVGGWTPGEGSAKELGAVVVGVYEDERLRFAGKVGSGFDGRTRKELRGAARGARDGRPAVRPAAGARLPRPLGRRPRGRPLDPARARDPGRDRRLDARRARAPDGVQGPRARPRPARGRARAGGRPGEGGSRGGRSVPGAGRGSRTAPPAWRQPSKATIGDEAEGRPKATKPRSTPAWIGLDAELDGAGRR